MCHGEVDSRICWHEVEFTVETIVLQHRSPPNLYAGSSRKFGVQFGKWWCYRHMVVNLSLSDTLETHSKEIDLNCLLQDWSTLTIGVPIGIPNGGRLVMSR